MNTHLLQSQKVTVFDSSFAIQKLQDWKLILVVAAVVLLEAIVLTVPFNIALLFYDDIRRVEDMTQAPEKNVNCYDFV